MQLMHASQTAKDVDKNLMRTKRAYDLLKIVITEIENKIKFPESKEDKTPEAKQKYLKEVDKYKQCLIDIMFNFLNLYRIKDDFV